GAEVALLEARHARRVIARREQRLLHLCLERREGRGERGELQRKRTEERADGLATHVGRRGAVGGEDGGETGDDDAADGEGACDRRAEERPAAAVAEQGEAAGGRAARRRRPPP